MVAAISLDVSTGNIGQVVVITGSGFSDELIDFTYNSVTIVPAEDPVTAVAGAFTATITIPASVKGAHAIVATDQSAGTDTKNFTVTQNIAITEATAVYGDTINVQGTGYETVSLMSFTLNSVAIVPVGGAVTTDANGSFTTTFLIPEVPNSTRTLDGIDAGTNSDTDTIDIQAICIITEASAIYGDTITIVGHGYEATSAVTTTLNSVSITAVGGAFSTGATGGFSKTFVIPDVANGTRTFVAADAGAGTDSDTLVINAVISLDDAIGNDGDTVIISGHGFTASSLMAFTFGGDAIVCDEDPLSSGATGAFTATITVPTGFDDSVTIVATDASAKTDSDTFTFVSVSATEMSLNTSFEHLNGGSLNIQSVGMGDSVERGAVVDIPFGSSDAYTTGGVNVDFSGIQGFTQVYLCKIIHNPVGLECSFIPGANNDSSLGKIYFWGADGNQLADDDTSIASKTLTVEIRGI